MRTSRGGLGERVAPGNWRHTERAAAGSVTPPVARAADASDPAAIQLGDAAVKASGGEHWPAVKTLHFTFQVEQPGKTEQLVMVTAIYIRERPDRWLSRLLVVAKRCPVGALAP